MKTWISVLLVLFAVSSVATARWSEPTPTPGWAETFQKQTGLEFSLGLAFGPGRMSLPPGVRDIPTYQHDYVDYDYTETTSKLEPDGIDLPLRCSLNPLPISWLSGLRTGLEVNWWHLGRGYYGQTRYNEGNGSESYVYSRTTLNHPILLKTFLGWQQPLSRGEDNWMWLEGGVEYFLTGNVGFNIEQGWYRYSNYTKFRRLSGEWQPQSRFVPYISLRMGCMGFLQEFGVRGGVNWDGRIDFEGQSRHVKMEDGPVELFLRLGYYWKAWYK